MTLKLFIAFVICLAALALVWLDGAALIEAVAGKIERPQTVLMIMIVTLGTVMVLLLQLHGTVERTAMSVKIKDHIHDIEQSAEHLFSSDEERRSEAGIALNTEPARRYAICQDGFARALKLFVVAAALALAAGLLVAKQVFDLGMRLL